MRELLAGLCDDALGVLVGADATAGALGAGAIGTDHLVLAILQAGGASARRLEHEELTLGTVRAAVTAGAASDSGKRSDPSTSCLSLPCTTQLQRVVAVARQSAVILESADVRVDHLLLAIASDGRCVASDILRRQDRAAAPRLVAAILDDLGDESAALWLPYTDTAREALELAWSTALALGYSEIGVSHILGGLRAPGWTIAARALALLAVPLPGDAAAPLAGYSNEAHHRIAFTPQARQALLAAATVARDLGKPYVGSEHVLLGIAAVAMDDVTALAGRSVTTSRVRDAVADAVLGADAAREQQARRNGRGEPAKSPDRGGARPETAPLRDQLMSRAREVAEADDGYDRTSTPGCWPGFVAAILLNEDAGLAKLLRLMALEPSEIGGLCEGIDDLPVTVALDWAAERYGGDVGVVELLIAAISVGSPRVSAVVYARGLTKAELVTQLIGWRDKRDGTDAEPDRVVWVAGANALLGVATSVLLIETVISQGAWWNLTLLGLVWSGPPALGTVSSIGVAWLLGFLASPLVGVVALLGVVGDLVQTGVERQAAWSRTGVRMTRRELACVARRTLAYPAARINQRVRQRLLAAMRARRPAMLRRADRHV
jgi:hypothetical protein